MKTPEWNPEMNDEDFDGEEWDADITHITYLGALYEGDRQAQIEALAYAWAKRLVDYDRTIPS